MRREDWVWRDTTYTMVIVSTEDMKRMIHARLFWCSTSIGTGGIYVFLAMLNGEDVDHSLADIDILDFFAFPCSSRVTKGRCPLLRSNETRVTFEKLIKSYLPKWAVHERAWYFNLQKTGRENAGLRRCSKASKKRVCWPGSAKCTSALSQIPLFSHIAGLSLES
jgi:hypothetical protein